MITPVIFRKWKDTQEIIALFPAEPADLEGKFCQSYMHIGQHSGAYYFGVRAATVPVTPDEYKELYNELLQIGYTDLKVYRRRASHVYDQFLAEVKKWR